MPWAKLDDRFYLNPKIMRAGLSARALYIAGLVHAAGGLTDGMIEMDAVPRIALLADVPKWRTAVARLVELGLWTKREDGIEEGYIIHDYLAYNPSREHVEHIRQERARVGKLGGRPPQSKTEEKQTESNLLSTRETPVPSRPIPVPESLNPEVEAIPVLRTAGARHTDCQRRFDSFWAVWPTGHKTGKVAARRVYDKLAPDDATQAAIIDGVLAWCDCQRWADGFVMEPARWLKEKRWEEEPPVGATNKAPTRVRGMPSAEYHAVIEDFDHKLEAHLNGQQDVYDLDVKPLPGLLPGVAARSNRHAGSSGRLLGGPA